jgi:hypothetical protein
VGGIHCRAAYLALLLHLVAGSNAAFDSKKAPKLAETIDLPQTFESDFQFAARQRATWFAKRSARRYCGRVGEDVFESLVMNEMISDFRLPYTWTFLPYDTDVNAFSLSARIPARRGYQSQTRSARHVITSGNAAL